MGHIVDKVVLDFRVTLLTEDYKQCKQESNQQYNRKNDAGNHEAHTGENVATHIRKMDLQQTHPRLGVVAEKVLGIGVSFSFVSIVRTAVHLASVSSRDGEVIGHIDAVVGQLLTNVVVEHAEIDAFIQRLVTSSI